MEKIVVVHSQLDEVPKVLSVEYHRKAIEIDVKDLLENFSGKRNLRFTTISQENVEANMDMQKARKNNSE